MGRPRSNTSTSTRWFSASRFGTRVARAALVARADLVWSSVRESPVSQAAAGAARAAALALRLVAFVDHAEAVAVGVNEDGEVFVRSVLALEARRTKAE
jgi:hypothetical protein